MGILLFVFPLILRFPVHILDTYIQVLVEGSTYLQLKPLNGNDQVKFLEN